MYAIYLFFMTIWWCYVWGDATACPYTHLEDVVEGKQNIRNAFLLIWAQLMGGLVVFRYNQLLWALEIVPTHKDRAFSDCSTDLQVKNTISIFFTFSYIRLVRKLTLLNFFLFSNLYFYYFLIFSLLELSFFPFKSINLVLLMRKVVFEEKNNVKRLSGIKGKVMWA